MRAGLLALAAAVMLPSVATAQMIIDNFSDAPGFGPVIAPAGMTTNFPFAGLNPTNTIGGTRSVDVGNPGATVTFEVNNAISSPGMALLGTAGATATSLSLAYDAGGAGLNADFSGASGISIDFNILDAAAIGSIISVTLTDGDSSTHSSSFTVTVAGIQTINLPFGGFSSFAGLNLGDIDVVQVQGAITPNGDIALDNIRTIAAVPEPASIVLWTLMFGAIGAFYAVRRRQAVTEMVA